MKKGPLPLLRQAIALLLFLPALLLSSCSDECESTTTYIAYEPVYMMRAELQNAVKVTPAQTLQEPGKIYTKGHYLFINEINKGVHIVDNSNPRAPRFLSFIAIPGNMDMAVKGNILYADNYIDLVAFDISNPLDVKLINRVENIFPTYFGMLTNDTASVFISEFVETLLTLPAGTDCSTGPGWRNGWMTFDGLSFASASVAQPSNSSGKGGSMARFTISGDHLYTVSNFDLQVLDISNATTPVRGEKISLGWGIETIFPYENKLFIGSTTGMHIYDNSNPTKPVHLSTYAHVNSCDPVVVEGDLAWVTLRSGNECAGFTNQLEVINISNPRSPKLVKTYPMQNPHGLGIDRSTLFLCEGKYGLKIFNAKDHLKVNENLISHFKEHDAFDVIPMGSNLLLIGQDGLYQYDYSNLKDIKLLSKLPVSR